MPKSDSTWLSYCYIVFGLVVAIVFNFAIHAVGNEMSWTETVEYFKHYNNAASVALGAVLAYWLASSPERREYHLSVVGEVRKVRWPTADATRQMTIIVAIVVAIFSVILFFFDRIWLSLLQWITG